MKIGRITLLDPSAPEGDRHGVEIERLIGNLFTEKSDLISATVTNSDEMRAALLRLCDVEKCPLVFTFGGTGAGLRDIAPETTLKVIDKELPGFGEVMRQFAFEKSPAAILSRAVAGIRGTSLIINLPTRPKAVGACLKLLRESLVEALEQVTGVRYELFVDPIVLPLEKLFSWLKSKSPTSSP